MSNLLNNSLTGLLAAQAGLRTTANNTANVNTQGYARQRVEQNALPGQSVGRISLGNGVVVEGVERIYDDFLAAQLRESNGLERRFAAFNEFAQRVDGLLGDTENGISPALQNFFDQLQTVAFDATSIVNRDLLIAQGESLESRFQQFVDRIDGVNSELNRRITDLVSTVNSTTDAIARANDQIVAAGDSVSRDLIDQRERLLMTLSEIADISTSRAPNGAINVLLGNGQPLVLNTQSFNLEAERNEFDPTRLEVVHVVGSRRGVVSQQIKGGELGGLLAYRRDGLAQARRALGMVAYSLAETFNDQHARGVDLNGNPGGDFFRSQAPSIVSSTQNTGTGTLTATVADPSGVQARDYIFRFDGAAWQASDADTGAILPVSGSGSVVDPFVIDGMEFVAGGSPAANDRFMIRLASDAAREFSMALSDPATIAAARPLSVSVSLSNISDSQITPITIDNPANPSLFQPVNIVFDDPNNYRIFDSGGTDLTGPQAYTSGADITFNGWRLQISGAPVAGDTFAVTPTPAGTGDNGNVVELSGVRNKGFLDGGRTSISDTIGDMIATVGGATLQSAQNLSAQSALRQQLELDLENVAGVNLDEEAVNALRYQEAFMASSRLIAMADQLFLSLLQAVRS
jgi:flagellar hook-associated protein 1 FlgK